MNTTPRVRRERQTLDASEPWCLRLVGWLAGWVETEIPKETLPVATIPAESRSSFSLAIIKNCWGISPVSVQWRSCLKDPNESLRSRSKLRDAAGWEFSVVSIAVGYRVSPSRGEFTRGRERGEGVATGFPFLRGILREPPRKTPGFTSRGIPGRIPDTSSGAISARHPGESIGILEIPRWRSTCLRILRDRSA